jgi:hypothetical protein
MFVSFDRGMTVVVLVLMGITLYNLFVAMRIHETSPIVEKYMGEHLPVVTATKRSYMGAAAAILLFSIALMFPDLSAYLWYPLAGVWLLFLWKPASVVSNGLGEYRAHMAPFVESKERLDHIDELTEEVDERFTRLDELKKKNNIL